MFKYDKFGQVSDALLIDFQLCRWTSPVIDIIYFTVNSMKFDVFDKYFDLLLNIYANTFNGVLRYLNCELESISVRQLTEAMETKYEYWVYLLFFSVVVQLREVKPGDTKETWMDGNGYGEELFKDVSKKWISYFIQKGRNLNFFLFQKIHNSNFRLC